jgi:hypothetical protein
VPGGLVVACSSDDAGGGGSPDARVETSIDGTTSDVARPSVDAPPAADAADDAAADAAVVRDAGVDVGAVEAGAEAGTGPVDHTPVYANIGPLGGTITHPAGATIVIPAGALADTFYFTLAGIEAPPQATLGATAVGQGFQLTPSAVQFLGPVQVTLPIASALVPQGAPAASVHAYAQTASSGTYVVLDSATDLAQDTLLTSVLAAGTFVPALVVQSPSTLAITTTSPLPTANVGSTYTTAFAASGGSPPYRWG